MSLPQALSGNKGFPKFFIKENLQEIFGNVIKSKNKKQSLSMYKLNFFKDMENSRISKRTKNNVTKAFYNLEIIVDFLEK